MNQTRRRLRAANPAILEHENAWRAKNAEKVSSWRREYQSANRDQRRVQDGARRSTPEQKRVRAERRRDLLYGLRVGEYDEMVTRQEGRCAICGTRPRKLFVDHNHTSGKVRKLLCHGCNASLGLMRESIENLENAIKYLRAEGGANG